MSMPSDMVAFNAEVAERFRVQHGSGPLTGGRLGTAGQINADAMLLLTTTGARSGEPRTVPLGWLRIDGQLVVLASNVGAPRHPGWYHNLVRNPRVTVELGAGTFAATARVATGAERERLWEGAVAQRPFFTDHQAKTDRQIPIVVLDPLQA